MQLTKNYLPKAVEERWYEHWMNKKYFNSKPDERKAFTVVIPPPNVTGVLHMGHTLNETVQDILVRKARMSGFNACWVPGSDHASIATEAKVVQMLQEKGIQKSSLSREEFLQYAFEWKDKYGGIIYNQIKKLGCSVDWDRVSFTMDDEYYAAVIKVFVDLFEKKMIYRGARMINWDTVAKTALSDEEVEYKDVEGTLYYVKYAVENSNEFLTIATQRPETIMGDTGVCVNPNDERYTHLKGRHLIVPLVNRKVPLIFDAYVDPAFGTGALKVTPAHDINDYNLGLKHHLGVIDTLNEDGTLSREAEIFVGEDRFVARKKIVELLREQGLLVKEEKYSTRLGYSQRTNSVVEPKISTQWFVKMKDLATPALEAVVNGDIKIHPGDKFLATYKYWLENVKDWCISRQLWWGQRIPAWYDADGRFVVAETEAEAHKKYEQQFNQTAELKQDEDVLDTWFSSWLWPIQVFNGITRPNNEDIRYYYPTSVLVTGQDIIFFWVARMAMAGYEYMNQKPFSDVYFTGMVRDKQGRKMSKSLGNSPDLLDLIDRYGSDAVRFGILIASPAGNDLLFDESSLEQGRNFTNKIWNALKLTRMWQEKRGLNQQHADQSAFAITWMNNRLKQATLLIEEQYSSFKLSEALKTLYSLIWDDFCSWYLEWLKAGFNELFDEEVYQQTCSVFEQLMQLLHPFMPFFTEEVYHLIANQNDDLIVKQFQPVSSPSTDVLQQGKLLQTLISAVRESRAKNNISMKEPVSLHIETATPQNYQQLLAILKKQANAKALVLNGAAPDNAIVIAVEQDKIFIEPENAIDTSAQKEELLKDLDYQQNFLASVMKKLSNEKFMANAKAEVVALEEKKKADAEARIKTIKDSLEML